MSILTIDQSKRVHSEGRHVSVAVGQAIVRVEPSDHVQRFSAQWEKVPQIISAAKIGSGISLLGMSQLRKELWIGDEKDGQIDA